jgi:outer membrane protein assembly factor BamD (BamD/ComL family)
MSRPEKSYLYICGILLLAFLAGCSRTGGNDVHVPQFIHFYNMGQDDFNVGKYDRALAHFKKSLVLIEEKKEPANRPTATVLNAIALTHKIKGDIITAELVYKRRPRTH